MPNPYPATGEVRVAASGINPGMLRNALGYGMPYARVIPHSDGAGQVDEIGTGLPSEWLGQAVWCYGAQSYRPFGTAAEFTVVPLDQVARLPLGVSTEQAPASGSPESRPTAPSTLLAG